MSYDSFENRLSNLLNSLEWNTEKAKKALAIIRRLPIRVISWKEVKREEAQRILALEQHMRQAGVSQEDVKDVVRFLSHIQDIRIWKDTDLS